MLASNPVPVPLGSRLLVRVLGLVLVVAAVLKATGTDRVETFAPPAWFARAEVKSALIAAEIVFGLWFISGIGVRAARRAAVALFVVFAVMSGLATLAGAPTCGCLGTARVSPAAVLVFDVIAVSLLVVSRFPGPWQPADRAAGRVALGAAALVALSGGVAVLWFGSWFMAVAVLRNRPVAIEPIAVPVGECRPGEAVAATVTFTNLTDEPIQVIMAQSDCSCLTADVPAWIPPKEARGVRVEVRPPTKPGPFARKIGWLTTVGQWSGELRGVVVDSHP